MNEFFALLQKSTIELPLAEVALLVLCLSVFLVMKMTRIGLIAAYLFTYRWGLLFLTRQANDFLVFYLLFGFGVGVLTIVGTVWTGNSD